MKLMFKIIWSTYENMELYMNQSQLFKLLFHGMECYQI